MTQRILLLSGKKQAGKDTTNNFLHGYLMRRAGVISAFEVDEQGRLLVNTEFLNAAGEKEDGMGVFDLSRTDGEFFNYMANKVWPYVKSYSFADELKSICMGLFGLTYDQCYGADEHKNSNSKVKWSDISFALPPRQVGVLKKIKDGVKKFDQFLTAREFLQQFGTNFCRKVYGDCWVDFCYNQVVAEGVPFAVITDGRFPNEIDAGKAHEVKTIRFLRDVHGDKHESELALDKYEWDEDNTFILDNSEMSIVEQNEVVLAKLAEWGWITAEV
jgi:hypothetical protein